MLVLFLAMTGSRLVHRPSQPLVDYAADFRNAPARRPRLDCVRLDCGPFPLGTQVVEIHHLLGAPVEAFGDLVDWQPLKGFTVRDTKRLRVESTYVFAREPGATRTSLSLIVDPRGPARLFNRLATTIDAALGL